MRHNLVVFNGGQGALKVLPPLVDVIPEARLNLVIYYLKHDGIEEAFELLKGGWMRMDGWMDGWIYLVASARVCAQLS